MKKRIEKKRARAMGEKYLGARITEESYEALYARAMKGRRSLSAEVQIAIDRYVAAAE